MRKCERQTLVEVRAILDDAITMVLADYSKATLELLEKAITRIDKELLG